MKKKPRKPAKKTTANNNPAATATTTTTHHPEAMTPSQLRFQKPYPRRPAPSKGSKTRQMILCACVGYFVPKTFFPNLLPYGGPAVKIAERPSNALIDPTNDSLQGKHGKLTKIYERLDEDTMMEPLLKGPKTVIIHPKDGTIYVLTEESMLVSVSDVQQTKEGATTESTDSGVATIVMTAKTTKVADLGMGRPLGGRFTPDGKTLYICDAVLGLLRITNPRQYPTSKVELVAHQFQDTDGTISKIHYANDLAIGSKSGKVYFTDSTDIMSDRIGSETWDTTYASALDMLRGKPMGRLLEYDPRANQIRVLVRNLRFASGVGIDPDEKFVLIAESFALQLHRYHLRGPRQGTLESIVESNDMTGYPDGVDCGGGRNRCYVALPSSVGLLAKIINRVPHPIDKVLRNFVMILPKILLPKASAYGGVIEVDPTTKEIQYFQDPTAKDIGMLSGVTVWDNSLYLGSFKNNYIGVYDLS